MTLQEVLDRNYRWFVVEGHGPSYVGAHTPQNLPRCLYRSVIDGSERRCAIGCCIDSSELLDRMDRVEVNSSLRRLIVDMPELADVFNPRDVDALVELQWAHDDSARSASDLIPFKTLFSRRLRTWAEENSLHWPESVLRG